MIRCPRCGSEVSGPACTLCGTPVQAPGAYAPRPVQYPAQPPQPAWYPGTPTYAGPGGYEPVPPPPPPPQRRGVPWLPVLAVVLTLAIAGVGVLVGQRLLGGTPATPRAVPPPAPVQTLGPATTSSAPAPSIPAPATVAAPPAPATSAPATTQLPVSGEEQAIVTLGQRAAQGRPALDAAVARRAWVAQLASKSVGITDPRQIAVNGTHTFYARDILAEHEQLAARVPDLAVILADSTTYGSRKTDTGGRPYWRTVVLGGQFDSKATVTAWCARTFAPLTGADLENQCVATQLG